MATADSTALPLPRDDIAAFFEGCFDAFGQIAAIIRAARDLKGGAASQSELLALLNGAHYIANDFENLADCWRGEVAEKGVRND